MKKLLLVLFIVSVMVGCSTAKPVAEILYFIVITPEVNDPPTISLGESAILSWEVIGVQFVSIDNDIGTMPAKGNMSVSPSAGSITYTLTAGEDSRSVTLWVARPSGK